jgi:pimeloyl-ACP methyl ester carboxylesterase
MTEPAKPPLVYLPGLDGTGRLLFRQPDLFQRYDVLCETYPQDRPQTYEELADTAAVHVRERWDGRRAIVLAESFGGAVALTFALRHQELVERMVLVNTFARYRWRMRIRLAAFFGRFLPRKPAHPATRPLRSVFFFSKDIPKADRDEWWKRTEDVPMRAFGYRLRLIAGLDLRPRLAEIRVSTLVLAAPDDRVVSAKAGREVARLLPNARLIEPRVGHGAMIHPAINIAELLDEQTQRDE